MSNIKVLSRKAEVITFIKKSLVNKDIKCDFVLPDLNDDFAGGAECDCIATARLLRFKR